MSTFTAFERAKLQRFINVYGNTFTFKRSAKNAYKEATNEISEVCKIDGVFRETSGGYVSETTANGSKYTKSLQPMILCLQDENSALLLPDDIVEIYDKAYKVVRLNNVGELGYAWDISLELIDDGSDV